VQKFINNWFNSFPFVRLSPIVRMIHSSRRGTASIKLLHRVVTITRHSLWWIGCTQLNWHMQNLPNLRKIGKFLTGSHFYNWLQINAIAVWLEVIPLNKPNSDCWISLLTAFSHKTIISCLTISTQLLIVSCILCSCQANRSAKFALNSLYKL